jgi:CheY-like chemotaxis protein
MSLTLADGVPSVAVGDPIRLRQILVNLLDNAVKFTSAGGVNIRVAVDSRSDQYADLRFDVEDSGIGIPDEAQETIFQSFTQADGSITRRYGGSGLGLTITQRLVELMGGRIGVTSSLRHGSTFSFTVRFGLSRESIAPPPAAELGAPRTGLVGRPLRVLVAEDNLVNRALIVRLLEREGCTVDVVGNGRDVLEAIERKVFDVVLMDVEMPEMCGHEATRHIREMEATKGGHLPIVALTAHALAEDRERCLAAGMDAYVPKPIRQRSLFAAIAAAMPDGEALEPRRKQARPPALKRTALADVFIESSRRELADIRTAAERGDRRSVWVLAHSIAGAAGVVGATAIVTIARDLETQARLNDLARIPGTCEALSRAIEDFALPSS